MSKHPPESSKYKNEFAQGKRSIYTRDRWECKCDRETHDGVLTIDHIRKRSLGGSNDKTNLITLRSICHDYFEGLPTQEKESRLYAILTKLYGYSYKNKVGITSG